MFFKDESSRWITRSGDLIRYVDSFEKQFPAPYFRRKFIWESGCGAHAAICGLGFYELYVNGRKVGDSVLDPIVSVYDRRSRYVVHDLDKYLTEGENTIGVLLGNGWYNCGTDEVWRFKNAHWRDYPKFIFELRDDSGKTILVSDTSWKCADSPIIFNQLRNGEFYDARLENDLWSHNKCDDSAWKNAVVTAPPGGILSEQTAPPCKVVSTVEAVPTAGNPCVYDAGKNMAGHARITVCGTAGETIVIRYAERLTANGEIDQEHQNDFIKSGDFQCDKYILKGGNSEAWEPRFTYHGFQWIQLGYDTGKVKILKVEARETGNAFPEAGEIRTSSNMVNKLWNCTRNSYRSNFVGIPTDCPHREKNGWTGDAQLAAETGLFAFDSAKSYGEWLETMRDLQRPSGEFPGIVPSSGWGYNWGNGPVWDSVIFVIPYQAYLFTGDDSLIRENYEAMKKYLEFVRMMSVDHIVQWGLGDWCPPEGVKTPRAEFCSTCYYYSDAKMLAFFAGLLGKKEDMAFYEKLSVAIGNSLNRHYFNGDDSYCENEWTSLAAPVYFGFCPESKQSKVVKRLAELVRKEKCHANFGIIGAKAVPRVLSDHGYADLALQILTQEEYPGWGNWVRQGATTLWENWDGNSSRNHIMYGDIGAWFFRYLAGFRHDPERPGTKFMEIRPLPVKEIEKVDCSWHGYRVERTICGDDFKLSVTVPQGAEARVILPSMKVHRIGAGTARFEERICWH